MGDSLGDADDGENTDGGGDGDDCDSNIEIDDNEGRGLIVGIGEGGDIGVISGDGLIDDIDEISGDGLTIGDGGVISGDGLIDDIDEISGDGLVIDDIDEISGDGLVIDDIDEISGDGLVIDDCEVIGDSGDTDRDPTEDRREDEMDDIDDELLAPGDIIGDTKNIDLMLPADDRLFTSFCAFCMTFQSICFGLQSLGMIPLSSNSSLSCSYNALKSSSFFKSPANLSKVRKSSASLNL